LTFDIDYINVAEGIPVALITAMTMVGKQIGTNRVVNGIKIPHPCGDPSLPVGGYYET